MSGIVIDASVFLASILHEEEDRQWADEAIETALEAGLIVPVVWHYEIRNALLKVLRQGRISSTEFDAALTLLVSLPLSSDSPPNLQEIMTLSRRHTLTFFDAVYVELAVRLETQLATLDQAMARAAEAKGVPIA